MIRFARILQRHWDWRAAFNFTFGGTGGALLALTALMRANSDTASGLALLALALIGAGLGCVWLEIGRPWRALNVFRHPKRSWMTREAIVASATFAAALTGLALELPALFATSGAGGLAFLYCQARILRASRGVPAWRQREIVPFVITTGVAEGSGLACLILSLAGQPPLWLRIFLVATLLARALAWIRYRAALGSDSAAAPGAAILSRLQSTLIAVGTYVAGAFALAALIAPPHAATIMGAAAGGLALFTGWIAKYVLVVRASHLQGYGFGKLRTGHPKSRVRA